MSKQQRIIAAANRCQNGMIVCGVRHGDMVMHSVFGQFPSGTAVSSEQGFIDNVGQFLTRKEAWKVATASGQLLPRAPTDGRGGTLYSEDVW